MVEVDIRKNFGYALLVESNGMNEEMLTECMETAVTSIEKHAKNAEAASKMLKDSMDKKFGPAWHVVIGEGFGFEVEHETKHLMYMFFGGQTAVLCWKCS